MEKTSKEEKRMMLYDLIEHPEKYSNEEINELLSDEEVRGDYELLTEIKHTLINKSITHDDEDIDVDEEWNRFSSNHHGHNWLKIAASIIGIVMVSGVAFALASHFVSRPSSTVENSKQEIVAQHAKDTNAIKQADIISNSKDTTESIQRNSVSSTSVTFEDVALKDILRQIADYHDADVEVSDERMLATRLYFVWDKNKSLEETIQLLNGFSRISLTVDGRTIKTGE